MGAKLAAMFFVVVLPLHGALAAEIRYQQADMNSPPTCEEPQRPEDCFRHPGLTPPMPVVRMSVVTPSELTRHVERLDAELSVLRADHAALLVELKEIRRIQQRTLELGVDAPEPER